MSAEVNNWIRTSTVSNSVVVWKGTWGDTVKMTAASVRQSLTYTASVNTIMRGLHE